LEHLIALAEEDTRLWASRVERLTGAGRSAGRAQDQLAAAEDRLELLRRSRWCLLTGEPPEAADPSFSTGAVPPDQPAARFSQSASLRTVTP
jgi:hypothetical protein